MSYVYLQHHGIKGQKWGVRRFQNADGSYTAAGKKRLNIVRKEKTPYEKVMKDYADKRGINPNADPSIRKLEEKWKKRPDIKQNVKTLEKAKDISVKAIKKAKPVVEDHTGVKNHVDKKEFRERRREVSKSRTFGAKLTTNLLAGPFANRTYNSVIAAGGSKEGAVGMTAVATVLGGPVGHIVVSAVYTNNASEKTYRK